MESDPLRFTLGVMFATLAFGPVPEIVTVVETVTVVEAPAISEPESSVDYLLDFDEIERQSLCLWHFMVQEELEITLESVLAAGAWSDLHGGACALMGEDDE